MTFSNSCKQKSTQPHVESQVVESSVVLQVDPGNTIESRFQPPDGFQRQIVPEGSFAMYLRTFPLLKPSNVVSVFFIAGPAKWFPKWRGQVLI